MKIVDRGSGTPVVVIPGIQGRWEWMAPAIDALARHGRVVTFSLADEPSAEAAFDDAHGFASYLEQVRHALDLAHLDRAAICGVSYGGLIAAAFAARYPDRTASLILVSALPPSWTPDARVRFYVRFPWLMTPLFCLASLRFYREIAAATDHRRDAFVMAVRHGANVVRHMFHPARMARRVRFLSSAGIGREVASVTISTLVVTGEEALERVVPPRLSRQYVDLLPAAQTVVIQRTGHLGLITRPSEFAMIISTFAARHAPESSTSEPVVLSRRRVIG